MRTHATRRTPGAKSVASSSRGSGAPRRGRPPKKVFINVEIKATTRDGLNLLKRKAGLRNQGELLDLLIAGQLQPRGGRTQTK